MQEKLEVRNQWEVGKIRPQIPACASLRWIAPSHPAIWLQVLYTLNIEAEWNKRSDPLQRLGPGMDDYVSETLFACLMRVILAPIAIPWGYVVNHYLKTRGNPWGRAGA